LEILGRNLNPRELMLLTAKKFFNNVFPKFTSKVPKVKPRKKICKLLHKAFEETEQCLKRQPSEYYKDGNFPRLVENVERLLLYIAENDGHYRAMLTDAILSLVRNINEEWNNFNHVAYYNKNKNILMINVPLDSLEAKTFLFYDYLIEHPMKGIGMERRGKKP